uniref:Glycoprotein B n=1 Tax=Loa loa TaxID=7209 RepID=A0A1I7VHX8_LOALO
PTVVAKLETETQPAWVVPHRCFHNSSTGTLLLNSSSLLIYFLRERSSTMYPSMIIGLHHTLVMRKVEVRCSPMTDLSATDTARYAINI